VVSVGQRILLAVDEAGMAALTSQLQVVQEPEPPETRRTPQQFVDAVAEAATAVYQTAAANVVVSTDGTIPRPYMKHVIRAEVAIPSGCVDTGNVEIFVYGCTNNDAKFPLLDPNLDLAPDNRHGISTAETYNGTAWGFDGKEQPALVPHLPTQPRNATSDLWSASNPSPASVLFNRYVNLVAHETAHGFGLMSNTGYPRPGQPPSMGQLYAVGLNMYSFLQGLYLEEDGTTDLLHEPIRIFGAADETSIQLLMQAIPCRWVNKYPFENDRYDTPVPPAQPSKWLVFDRPLRFSTQTDYLNISHPDRSITAFFRERIPVCEPDRGRDCR